MASNEGSWERMLLKLVEEIQRLDWSRLLQQFDDATARHLDAARVMAEKGWTIPAWMGISDPLELCKLSEAEMDATITASFVADDFSALREHTSVLIATPEMGKWAALLLEIQDSLVAGRYLVTVPALLTILEGFTAQHLVRTTSGTARNTNVVTRLEELGLHTEGNLQALPAISNVRFLQLLFAPSNFNQQPPPRVNRHWVLHGRDSANWTLADAVRLFNALDTLCWLLEMIRERELTGSSEPRSESVSA